MPSQGWSIGSQVLARTRQIDRATSDVVKVSGFLPKDRRELWGEGIFAQAVS